MKLELTTSQAADMLLADKNAGWTYAGARALVEYLEDLEDDLGSIDFDAVAIRCDFTEYASEAEPLKQYDCDSIEDLEDETTVIHVPGGGVIVADF